MATKVYMVEQFIDSTIPEVLSIFSTRDKAKEYVRDLESKYPSIELYIHEFTLDLEPEPRW